jgi:hypothetical protein
MDDLLHTKCVSKKPDLDIIDLPTAEKLGYTDMRSAGMLSIENL